MKLSLLEIKARARIARVREQTGTVPQTQPPPPLRGEVIQADPKETLDSWERDREPSTKAGSSKPKKNQPKVPEISAAPETSPTPPKRRKPSPPASHGTWSDRHSRAPRAMHVPKDAAERIRKLTLFLTPEEEKEIRDYVYKWQLPITEWGRLVLLDKIRNDY